jgi:quercetin dioxygenase-like cupin family protein
MTASTPHLAGESKLGALASRYVDVDALPWKPTRWSGIEMKILVEDQATGLLTALFRWAPGSELPYHEHVRIEQTYVLQGSLVDEEGEAHAGQFVWRPAGSRHVARAPHGALILGFFLAPNTFLTEAQPAALEASPASAWGVR